MELLKKENKNNLLRVEIKDIDLGLLEYIKRKMTDKNIIFRYYKPHPLEDKIIIEIEKEGIKKMDEIIKELEEIKRSFNV